jgi:hypothetical protein
LGDGRGYRFACHFTVEVFQPQLLAASRVLGEFFERAQEVSIGTHFQIDAKSLGRGLERSFDPPLARFYHHDALWSQLPDGRLQNQSLGKRAFAATIP